jgi:hypothetical protein
MKAVITGENEERVGVNLLDNNDAEHVIEMEFDGEIKHHQCEAYADKPKNRTPAENEYNEQARKFAQYYVYLERGYDTAPPEIHPERINAVREAIAAMDKVEFKGLFGDLYSQIASHQGAAERVLDLPEDIASPDSVLYRHHVYLGFDPLDTEFSDEAESLAGQYDLDLSGEAVNETVPSADLDSWRAFTDGLADLAADAGQDLSEGLYVDGVSSLYLAYVDEAGHEHIEEPDSDPYTREPDTLIELPPMEVGTLSEFQEYLNHNLACQIRDCFARMGLEPPEPFQILGFGRLEAAEQYRRLEMFPNYIDPEEEQAFV